MKNMSLYIVLLAIFSGSNAFARCDRSCKTQKNIDAATAYCNLQKQVGIDCKIDNNRGCGSGWTNIKKFDEGGDSYFACIKTAKQEQTEKNKKDAEDHCNQLNASGEYCVVSKGNCGSGLKELKEFNGRGEKYKSCGRTKRAEGTEQNKNEAQAFCDQFSKTGQHCEIKAGHCGSGLSKVKEFGGAGRNYVACTKSARAEASEENMKEAEDFCSKVNSGAGSVLTCEAKTRCSGGFVKIKEVKGKGKNYDVCLKAR